MKFFRYSSYICFLCLLTIISPLSLHAGGDSFTQKDRELLIRLDERLNQMDKRFEQIDKRFEQVDKRLEELRDDMNRRFEQVDKRFESMQQLMLGIIAAFAAIVAVAIGFAIWDRRTMVRPFETKVKQVEGKMSEEDDKTDRLISVLREYAKHNKEIAQILRSFHFL